MLLLILAFFFFFYIFARLSVGRTRSAACLVGKTAIVTGANSGIGYQTVLNLASRGCRVIMADVADMDASRQNVIKYTGNTNIATKKVDLSSLASVREFAKDIVKTEQRLDILINNAGILMSNAKKTNDGLHPVMQINYFGPFLLTYLLIDLLKKSAPSRVVFASSLLAFTNNLSLDNFNHDDNVTSASKGWLIYGNSKLATIIASDIFAKKLEGTGVTCNSTHPGVVSTQLFSKGFAQLTSISWSSFVKICLALFSKDVWEGSQTLLHVAVSTKLKETTGEYFVDCRPFPKPWSAYDAIWCQKIWDASEDYVGLQQHERI